MKDYRQFTTEYLFDVGNRLQTALEDDATPEVIKTCLKAIVEESAINADSPVEDFRFIRFALSDIARKLGDYGRGVVHALDAILQHGSASSPEEAEEAAIEED